MRSWEHPLAEQRVPVRRNVAIKLIRASLASPAALALFSAERQAMARLTHPAIAQMFEAGTTDDGFPYFVMKHVPGEPLARYCDRKRLGVDERLELFIQICGGVEHAHRKGILHRDLKPANILVSEVDGRPAPKIIDFGIAKALDHPLTDETLLTRFGLGTPSYMSPEAFDAVDLARGQPGATGVWPTYCVIAPRSTKRNLTTEPRSRCAGRSCLRDTRAAPDAHRLRPLVALRRARERSTRDRGRSLPLNRVRRRVLKTWCRRVRDLIKKGTRRRRDRSAAAARRELTRCLV